MRCLDVAEPEFNQVSCLFVDNWKHPRSVKPRPRICAIYEVRLELDSLLSYHSYRNEVQLTTKGSERFFDNGNETLLFHGTDRLCAIGEHRKSILPCFAPACRLCCIIRRSYDIRKSRTKHNFSRFGKGVYTTSCSSKADDYAKNLSDKPKFKAMLVNRVLVGKSAVLTRTNVALSGPPNGYHSVQGKPGADLNYPETVVYRDEAIRPAYLVIYGDQRHEKEVALASKIRSLFRTPLAS